MDKYQERILNMIKDADFFFDAVQTAGNEAMRRVGHNCSYELVPGIVVRYELLDHGPENVHYYDQYAPDPSEYGNPSISRGKNTIHICESQSCIREP